MKDYVTLARLDRLADQVIRGVLEHAPHVREGVVMTGGVPPYRRLDCDGRALAYVRSRPRKKAVRIDVSGLWIAGRRSRLAVPHAGGSLTLIVREESDVDEVIGVLVGVVADTRAAIERRQRPAAPPTPATPARPVVARTS